MADRREEYGAARNRTDNLRCFSWQERQLVPDIRYDLIINLEDTLEVGLYLKTPSDHATLWSVRRFRESATLHRRFKALVLISVLSALTAERQADKLKLKNRPYLSGAGL